MNVPGLSHQQGSGGVSHLPAGNSPGLQGQAGGFGAMLATVMKAPEAKPEAAPQSNGQKPDVSVAEHKDAKSSHSAKTAARANKTSAASSPAAADDVEGKSETDSPTSTKGVADVETKSGEEEPDKEPVPEEQDGKADPLQAGLLALVAGCAPVAVAPPIQPLPLAAAAKTEREASNEPSDQSGATGAAAVCGESGGKGKLVLDGLGAASLPMSVADTSTLIGRLPAGPVASGKPVGPSLPEAKEKSDATLAAVGESLANDKTLITDKTLAADKTVAGDRTSAGDKTADTGKTPSVDVQTAVPITKAQADNARAGESVRVVSRADASRVELKAALAERTGDSRNSETVGTGTAPHVRQMSSAEQQNEFADRGKQNLPEPAEAVHAPAPMPGGTAAKSDVVLNVQANSVPAPSASFDTNASTASVQQPAHTPVARLAGAINHEMMILRQFKPDKLDVVLRPDPDTQISLQLRLNGSEVQGIARCERGDYNLLNVHWNELQKTMEQQGVRLAPLKESGASMSFSNGNSFGNPSQTAHDQRGRKLEDVFVSEKELTPRPVDVITAAARGSRPVSASNLLQAWA